MKIKMKKKNEKESIRILYYDCNDKENLLVRDYFYEEEARYLIYILNNYLQGNNPNYIIPITPYNNY